MLRQTEARQQLGDLLDLDLEQRSETFETDLQTLNRQLRSLETELESALLTEVDPVETPAEDRGLGELLQRVSLGAYLSEAVHMQPLDTRSAEAELRSETLGDAAQPGQFPLDVLDPGEGLETRADAATTVAAAAISDRPRPVIARIFARSVASQLGLTPQPVATGDQTYPLLTGGASASMMTAGAARDAEKATFSGQTLSPSRATARYVLRIEDIARFGSLERVLRADLRAAISDAMDAQIISGNGTAPNLSGLTKALTAPDDPNAVTDWAAYYAAFTGTVDGKHAQSLRDLRVVVGATTWTYAESLIRSGANDRGPTETAADYVRSRVGSYTVSSFIPAAASNIQTNIVHRASVPGLNAAWPVWRGASIIADPYSGAASGEVALTIHVLFSFKVLRTAAWVLFKVKTA